VRFIMAATLVSVITLLPSFVPGSGFPRTRVAHASSQGVRMEFGDGFYVSHTSPPPYGPTSGDGTLPEGVYELSLQKPLGINFEENGYPKRGVTVIGLVSGGNAERSGKISVGDDLVGVTAVRIKGAKYERQMFDCSKWTFDTVVDAIQSNDEKFQCADVVLQFKTAEASTE